jgi:ATP-dependent RNA helicase DDX24/MAK5
VKAAGKKPLKSILKGPTTAKDEGNHDGEEWSGFTDEEPVAESQQTETSQKGKKEVAKPDKDNKKDKLQKKQKAAEKPQNRGIQSNLSFAALQDEEEDGVDVSAWGPLGLSPSLQTGLSKLKFASPTPIQKACVPEILAGHDVIGKAATGSGKTLAFGIPILEEYLDRKEKQPDNTDEKKESVPIALILSPTRELAHQIGKHIEELNTHTPDATARIALLTGGLSIQKQQRLLTDADIVIGTPGRVWEILSTGHGLIRKMKQIKFLVVDEADRLLSEGHFKEVEEILNALDRTEDNNLPDTEEAESEDGDSAQDQRQTLVFSATFHRGLQQKLAGKSRSASYDLMDKKESMEYLLKKLNFREERPKFIDANPVSQMAEGLKEGIVECAATEKVSVSNALSNHYSIL